MKVHKSYSPYTTSCGPFLPCSTNRSLIYLHLASPNSNCLPVLSLIRCNLKTDRLNHTALYAIHISDHVFPHKCIRENACILFTDYTHSESTCMFLQHEFLQKPKNLIIPEVPVPSLHPLSFCNMSSTTYQTQRKISNIAKLFATELLTLLFPSVLLNQKNPSLPLAPLAISYLPLVAKIVLLKKEQFLIISSKLPLASSRSFSKSSNAVPFPFSVRSLATFINLAPSMPAAIPNLLHSTQLRSKTTMHFHATMMGRRHNKSVDVIMSRTQG